MVYAMQFHRKGVRGRRLMGDAVGDISDYVSCVRIDHVNGRLLLARLTLKLVPATSVQAGSEAVADHDHGGALGGQFPRPPELLGIRDLWWLPRPHRHETRGQRITPQVGD